MAIAQFAWESLGFTAREEIACSGGRWEPTCNTYDRNGCPSHNSYHGRGFIQLTHCYNYRAASQGLFGDDRLVHNPHIVAQDDVIAMRTALWFWKRNVHSLPGISSGRFGEATRAINGPLECNGNSVSAGERWLLFMKVLDASGNAHLKSRLSPEGCNTMGGYASSQNTYCMFLWDNQCQTDSQCCSGYCDKGPDGNWAKGVCKPPNEKPARSRESDGCMSLWNNQCQSDIQCCSEYCDKGPDENWEKESANQEVRNQLDQRKTLAACHCGIIDANLILIVAVDIATKDLMGTGRKVFASLQARDQLNQVSHLTASLSGTINVNPMHNVAVGIAIKGQMGIGQKACANHHPKDPLLKGIVSNNACMSAHLK